MAWKPVYLFWGDEWYLKKKELDQFVEQIPLDVRDFNLDVFEEQSVSYSELKDAVSTLPVFCDQRLVVLKNSRLLGTAGKKNRGGISEEQLFQVLNNLNSASCLLILAEGNVDRRKKAYKLIAEQGEVKEFGPLKGRELLAWLNDQFEQRGKKIAKDAAQLILDSCSGSLSQLLQEVEKISLYCGERPLIDKGTVSGLISPINQETIFQLVDAVAEKNGKLALQILQRMLDDNESPLKILFMVTRQFRLIFQVKSLTEQGQSPKMLASILRQPPFVVHNCLRQGRRYSIEELNHIFDLLLAADSSIKTGRYQPRLALELLVAKLVG